MSYSWFSEIHQKSQYLTHFWANWTVLELVLMGKPVGLWVRVWAGMGMGYRSDTHGFTHAIAWNNYMVHAYFGTDHFFHFKFAWKHMMDTIPSPKIEIKSKYFRATKIPAYTTVLGAYDYTYVVLYIHHCLKGNTNIHWSTCQNQNCESIQQRCSNFLTCYKCTVILKNEWEIWPRVLQI